MSARSIPEVAVRARGWRSRIATPRPRRVWNRNADHVREQLALDEPELSPREVAVTDERSHANSRFSRMASAGFARFLSGSTSKERDARIGCEVRGRGRLFLCGPGEAGVSEASD